MASRSISSIDRKPRQCPGIRGANALRQVFGRQRCVFAKNQRPLEGILQLANIARPVVTLQRMPHRIAQRHAVAAVNRRQARQHMFRQRHDIRAPLAQRGHVNRQHAQPEIQVFAKPPRGDGALQVRIGERDQPRFDA